MWKDEVNIKGSSTDILKNRPPSFPQPRKIWNSKNLRKIKISKFWTYLSINENIIPQWKQHKKFRSHIRFDASYDESFPGCNVQIFSFFATAFARSPVMSGNFWNTNIFKIWPDVLEGLQNAEYVSKNLGNNDASVTRNNLRGKTNVLRVCFTNVGIMIWCEIRCIRFPANFSKIKFISILRLVSHNLVHRMKKPSKQIITQFT